MDGRAASATQLSMNALAQKMTATKMHNASTLDQDNTHAPANRDLKTIPQQPLNAWHEPPTPTPTKQLYMNNILETISSAGLSQLREHHAFPIETVYTHQLARVPSVET